MYCILYYKNIYILCLTFYLFLSTAFFSIIFFFYFKQKPSYDLLISYWSSDVCSSDLNWAYKTDPEPHMNNRRMDCGRGKGLGGSSLINGMCYIRGNALDYDNWAKTPGLEDWTYLDCLPYFRKAESRDIGPNDYHGGDGPVSVTTPTADNNELFHAMVEAGVQAGFPRSEEPTSELQSLMRNS